MTVVLLIALGALVGITVMGLVLVVGLVYLGWREGRRLRSRIDSVRIDDARRYELAKDGHL